MISLILLAISFWLYRKGKEVPAAVSETLGLRIGFIAGILALILWIARTVCHSIAEGELAILGWCNSLTNAHPAECITAIRSAVVWGNLGDNIDVALITMLIL